MNPTLTEILAELYAKAQAVAALSAKVQEQAAEIERLTAAQKPPIVLEPEAQEPDATP